MGSVRANQSNQEKTGTDKEGNNEKRTHIELPTPRDWACGSENDPSPAFIKFRVQPSQIGDKYLSLNGSKVNTTRRHQVLDKNELFLYQNHTPLEYPTHEIGW